jgi:hypothetical protein
MGPRSWLSKATLAYLDLPSDITREKTSSDDGCMLPVQHGVTQISAFQMSLGSILDRKTLTISGTSAVTNHRPAGVSPVACALQFSDHA